MTIAFVANVVGHEIVRLFRCLRVLVNRWVQLTSCHTGAMSLVGWFIRHLLLRWNLFRALNEV